MPAKADSRAVLDTLVRDAVRPIAKAGRVPNTEGMRDVIVGVLEQMDRKAADRPPVVARPTRRLVQAKPKPKPKLTGLAQVEAGIRGRLIDRVHLIMRYPEMYQKLKNLSLCLHSPKKEVRHQAAEALIALVNKTNGIVGHDWRVPPPEKLVFSG